MGLYCDFVWDNVFLFVLQLNVVGRIVLSEIELFHEWGNKKSVCVRVGYIGIDGGDNSDDASLSAQWYSGY